MKIIGIIAEYNPFHKGHEYQIQQAKASGADAIVIAMSGDFVQRGEPAIVDKYVRTEMALRAGADLVIEIPVIHCLSDAGGYAYGGISVLNNLGVIDELAFGVEEGCEESIVKIASFLNESSAEYEQQLDSYLNGGMNYPTARATALREFLDEETCMALEYPNAILAIEYCKELLRINSTIKPHPIVRKGAGYNDENIREDGFSSASAIRRHVGERHESKEVSDILSTSIPGELTGILGREYGKSFPILPEDYSLILHSQLLKGCDFADYYDISDSFAARMEDKLPGYLNIRDYADRLKSKNITYASVMRLLMHAALGLTEADVTEARRGDDYIRILGLRKDSKGLMKAIKEKASVPIISKLADAERNPQLELDIRCANIYESVVTAKFGKPYVSEYARSIVVV